MTCQVFGCRFPSTHLTFYHKCGNCNIYGHGQYECRNENLKQQLYTTFMDKNQTISSYDHCSIETCKFPWSHSTIAHHCQLCGKNGHDKTTQCEYIIYKKCPICKIDSHVNLNNLSYNDSNCCICLTNDEQKVVFETCKHGHVCKNCINSL